MRLLLIVAACLLCAASLPPGGVTPSLTFDFMTPQIIEPQPISDAAIAAVTSGISARQTTLLTAWANSPFPSTTCQVPAVANDSCWVGKLSAALVLYTLDRNNTDITNASAFLQSALDGLPAAQYFTGIDAANGYQDTFHFLPAQVLYRILHNFGPSGSVHSGLVTQPQYDQAVTLFFNWASNSCRTAEIYQNSNPLTAPFYIWLTENNSVMKDTACLAADYLGAASVTYQNQPYVDGTTPAQQLPLQIQRAQNDLRRIGRFGTPIEYYSGSYSEYLLAGISFYADLAADATTQTLAQNVLNLWWSGWAQEQANGNDGGAAVRMYFDSAIANQPAPGLGWLYFNVGTQTQPDYPSLGNVVSSYVPPVISYAIALDPATVGSHEVFSRSLGTQTGSPVVVDVDFDFWYLADANVGSLQSPLRYTYVGVDANNAFAYSLSSTMVPRLVQATPHGTNVTGWMDIDSQNRRYGVAFGSSTDYKKKVLIETDGASATASCDNCTWGAQSKSLLVAQELSGVYAYRAGNIHAYFETTMTRNETGGWIFCDCGTGWAAVRPAWGTYSWDTSTSDHQSISISDNTSPLVLQVASKTDYTSLADFEAAVINNLTFVRDTTAKTLTVTGLLGSGTIVFDYQNGNPPLVNGIAPDFSNAWAWRSSFMTETFGSSTVNVSVGNRTATFSFN